MTTRSHQPPLLFSGTANKPFARQLAKELQLPLSSAEVLRFSDSEIRVTVAADVAQRDVYIIQSTSAPANENILELLLIAHALHAAKPWRLTAVMPFFGYRRQEKTTQPGESLAFQLMAKLMRTAGITRVLVIDLHKHRSTRFFKEFSIVSKELRAFDLFVEYFKQKDLRNLVVLAPDKGGIPESERYARALGVPLVKVYKRRRHDQPDKVFVNRMEGEVRDKNVLIIDDEINTAGTLVGVVELLKKHGNCREVFFAATHGVLSGPAVQRLTASPLTEVVLTNSIYLPPSKRLPKIKVLSAVPLFAKVIRTWAHLK